ncbi:hypothetical protein [Bacillus thuringiensis]|uniref:hypothetical protein n=1 Tax=Bacillus thuringiensis TaxID=1428 RepID=UPI0012F9D8A5|nr:hypothetical protein [Bacillus thuringiensis]
MQFIHKYNAYLYVSKLNVLFFTNTAIPYATKVAGSITRSFTTILLVPAKNYEQAFGL